MITELKELKKERYLNWLCWVYRCSRLCGAHVRSSARLIRTLELGKSREIIVEAIQPHCTVISCQTPLPDNNPAELPLHIGSSFLLLAGVNVKTSSRCRIQPGLVDMCIDGAIRTASHEATPKLWAKAKGVVHDVLPVWSMLLNNEISIPVVLLEMFEWSPLPWLIYWFQTQNSWMTSIFLYDLLNNSKRMLDVTVVDL